MSWYRSVTCLIIVACMASIAQAQRPTTEEVAQAVTQSREARAKSHPPPTQAEAIAGIDRTISATRKLTPARMEEIARNPNRQFYHDWLPWPDSSEFPNTPSGWVKVRQERLNGLLRERQEAKQDYQPKVRLSDLNWDNLHVGHVGHVGEVHKVAPGKIRGTPLLIDNGGRLKIHDITSENECIAEYTAAWPGQADRHYGKVIIRGINTREAVIGRLWDLSFKPFSAVVVGLEYTAYGNLPILEVFDPDQPFK